MFHISALKDPVFENNLYYNIQDGDPLYGQLALSEDKKGIIGVDPQFTMPADGDYCGYEKAYLFAGGNSALYKKGISIATMLKYDIQGNGAFAKKA